MLAIDEPTNHVDVQAREIITRALHSFKGIGLIVSHDRELLDSLCYQCIFIDPPGVSIRPGGYTQAMKAIEQEQQFVKKHYLQKKECAKKASKRSDTAESRSAKIPEKAFQKRIGKEGS